MAARYRPGTQEWGAFNLDSDLMVIPRRHIYSEQLRLTAGPGIKWKSKYGALGVNGMHLPMYIDGMNEKGTVFIRFYTFPGNGQV